MKEIEEVAGILDNDWGRIDQVASGQVLKDTLRIESFNSKRIQNIADHSGCGELIGELFRKANDSFSDHFVSIQAFESEVVDCINKKNTAGIVVSVKGTARDPILYVDITPKLAQALVKAYAIERRDRRLKIKHSRSHLLPSEIGEMGLLFLEVLGVDEPIAELQKENVEAALEMIAEACAVRELINRPARTAREDDSERFLTAQISAGAKREIASVVREFFVDLEETTYGTNKEKALDGLIQIANNELQSKVRERGEQRSV